MNMNQFQEFKSRTQAVRGSIHRYKWNTGFAVRRTNMLMPTRESFATGTRVIFASRRLDEISEDTLKCSSDRSGNPVICRGWHRPMELL